MGTVIWRTVINVCGTRGARPARRALTLEAQRGLPAAASVVAGVGQAGVLRDLTVGA